LEQEWGQVQVWLAWGQVLALAQVLLAQGLAL
jgi:hypothetical protein